MEGDVEYGLIFEAVTRADRIQGPEKGSKIGQTFLMKLENSGTGTTLHLVLLQIGKW